VRPIYLDHHATTPVDPRVAEAMWPYFTEKFGNASGRHHRYGWEADEAVEKARAQVAGAIGARAREVIFTSGATESNNLALKGVLRASARRHIVTVTTEHASILDPCKRLVAEGARVTQVHVMRDGLLDLDQLRDAVSDDTAVVSVMAANNEIGVLQPLAAVAAIAHERGAWFHTDAVQAIGKVPFDVEVVGADLVSMTAHKFYGPKGVGALYIRRRQSTSARGASAFAAGATADRTEDRPRVEVTPQLDGGGQERGFRSGTLNVPGIVGLGAAAELATREMPEEAPRLSALRDRLLKALLARVPGLVVNGTLEARLPGNLNVSFPGVDGEALLIGLEDVAVSSGAACTASQPSHVLRALGHPVDLALASLRFGLGRSTTTTDVDIASERVSELVTRLRSKAYAGATSAPGAPGRTLRVEAGL
jgi:cysteine desulfurase